MKGVSTFQPVPRQVPTMSGASRPMSPDAATARSKATSYTQLYNDAHLLRITPHANS